MTMRGIARSAVVVPVTVAAMWFAGAFTAASVMAAADPRAAAAIWPTDNAVAGQASALVVDRPSRREAVEAIRLGRAVLARNPVNAEAVRDVALGRLVSGDYAAGHAALELSEALSRRDAPTQASLIEDRVQAGDVAGALAHYDRVLRTHPETGAVILPVLARAADDPVIARRLAARLAARPEWWSDFLGRFLSSATSPAAIGMVADGLRLDPASQTDRERLVTVFARLVALGDVGRARTLYDRATGTGHGLVVDGGFGHDRGMPPFDWQIADDAGTASRDPRDGATGAALSLGGAQGREAARQLLVLPPGRYRLEARTAGIMAGMLSPPTVTLSCAGAKGDGIATTAFPAGEAPHRWAIQFTVPTGCPGQWLVVASASDPGFQGADPWIDDVAVRRLDGDKAHARPGMRG